jgi:hypothetical protein
VQGKVHSSEQQVALRMWMLAMISNLVSQSSRFIVTRLNETGTTDVSPYSINHGTYEIVLIDTPGFNDTLRGETEVLKDLADWLDITYRTSPKIKLSGIIYMQALTDRRIYGSTLRNLKMFRQLCGDQPLKNVIFTTTGWGEAEKTGNLEKAVANEDQLRTDPDFWQPMINRGSRTARFEDTKDSALEIILSLVDKETVVLQIQHELADEDKNLVDTAAGAIVNEEIKKLEENYKKQLTELQEEINEALESRDQELQEALTEAKTSFELLRENNRMAYDLLNYQERNAQRKYENEMQALKNELENQNSTFKHDKQAMKAIQMQAKMRRNMDQVKFEQMVAEMRANAKVRKRFRHLRELECEMLGNTKGETLLMRLPPTID